MTKIFYCPVSCAKCATLAFALLALPVSAQQRWTLEQCCDYAVAHNISLRQRENQRQQKELQVSNALNERLPDLSASVGENFSFGRGLTADNTYTNTNTSSTSFSLGTSVPLFTGFRIPNQIKLSRLNLEAATTDLEKARNDIRMQVAQEYVQVLFNEELLGVARRQVSIDSAQVARLEALFAAGRVSEAELAQQRSTLAQSRLTATQAANNLKLALLDLSQLLELDSPEGFAVEAPLSTPEGNTTDSPLKGNTIVAHPGAEGGTSDATLDEVLADALAVKPEIRSEQLRLEAADRSIDIARAALYPSLSFSAGMGTNYYSTSGMSSAPFGRQLKNNFNQYLGFNLSIPIFNRFATRNSIRSAKIDRMNQQLTLDNAKKTLRKEVQTAWYNTIAAREKLTSSSEARQASEAAFRLAQAKYEQGKSTITEFNEAKNNLMKAESDLTQARYEYLYQTALIKFYRGEPLRL